MLLPSLILSLLGGCQPLVPPPDADSLCASLKTSSLDDCNDITSDCLTVYCVPSAGDAASCGLAERFPSAIVSEPVLAAEAEACDALEGARWREWQCSEGPFLVACQGTE